MKEFTERLRKEVLEQKGSFYRVPLYVSKTPLRVLKKVGDVVCTPRIFKAKEAMTGDKLVLLYDNQILKDNGNGVVHLLYSKERLGDLHDRLVTFKGFAAFVCESDFDEEHKIINQEVLDYCNDFEHSAYNTVINPEKAREKVKK